MTVTVNSDGTHTMSHALVFTNVSIIDTPVVLSPGATVNIDCTSGSIFTLSLDQDTTFTVSNQFSGANISIRLVCDGSLRSLYFPAWKFMGSAAPTTIDATKTAVLALSSYGTSASDMLAAYTVEP